MQLLKKIMCLLRHKMFFLSKCSYLFIAALFIEPAKNENQELNLNLTESSEHFQTQKG